MASKSNKSQVPPEPEPESESESESSESNTHSSENEESATSSPPSSPPSKKPTTTPQSSSSSDGDNDLHVNSTPKPTAKPIEKDNNTTTKSTPGPNQEGSSKKLFERIFSEEDEIDVLKGLIAFKDQKTDGDSYGYGFVVKHLHGKFTKSQVVDKIRRLKMKFTNAVKSKKKNLNPHDKALFDLSKEIWEVDSDDNDVADVGNSVSKNKKDNEEADCNGDGDVMDVDYKVGEEGVKEAVRSEAFIRMGKKKRDEIRGMWKEVEMAQLKVDVMRSKARAKENRRIIKALGSPSF